MKRPTSTTAMNVYDAIDKMVQIQEPQPRQTPTAEMRTAPQKLHKLQETLSAFADTLFRWDINLGELDRIINGLVGIGSLELPVSKKIKRAWKEAATKKTTEQAKGKS